ncbi:beta-L-arabinofuranosidase domain-containing protein [Paenibacillus glycanilyticus]|uniref:Glycosyl hydrolase n=1 Tax=Paenibacillus glycanilyticus TaxID=126569 RepID=A0ABQ6G745_9BACL|nr:beta-L-arabinofuranosidase domain-containing protein [Paenibacillus glycanilyticus]GLX66804.1 hypothetical protein MU1_11480 [Paenibacillus glycanilyticus]
MNLSLTATTFAELPLGAIKPQGWLKDQLDIQAKGMTGHLDEFWPSVRPNSGWLGGTGESWERGPYYLDGLLPLAYLLEDERLIEKVKPWIEWTLGSGREDGQFGPSTNDDWWSRTREPFLLELARLIGEQTEDWKGLYEQYPYWYRQTSFDHRVHVVNVAMSFKQPALRFLLSGETADLESVYTGIRSVMNYHGQVNGMFSGDEWLAGTHPSQGTELCAVVEYMYSLEHLVRITGDGYFGDLLEKVAYNALPAAISPDWKVHQYDQQANQIMCTHAKRNWTENNNEANMFGIEPHFGCCTANMHQGWPKFAARLWMSAEDGGLAAISYAPCLIATKVGQGNGTAASIQVETSYPFLDTVKISVNPEMPVRFPVKLRIPSWCAAPTLLINGERYQLHVERGFASIDRIWQKGDELLLTLPKTARLVPRANGAAGVQYGALMLVIPVKEQWQKHRTFPPYDDWELYPASPWNYGLQLNEESAAELGHVFANEIVRQPFSAEHPPLRMQVSGRRIPEWTMEMNSAGTPPQSPVSSKEPLERLELIPYGCARLRIAEFPLVR